MTPGPTTISGVAATIAARWQIVVGVLLGVLTLAVLGMVIDEPSATSRSKVQLSPLRTASGASVPIDFDTERVVATSQAVGARVAKRLADGSDWSDAVSQVEVGSPAGTQILTFTVTDPDPVRAARVASLFANEYLDFRRDTYTRPRPAAAEAITEQIEVAESQLDGLGPAEAAAALEQIVALEDERRALERPSVSGGRVVAHGTPATTSSPPAGRLLLAGGALGLLLGCYAALLADRLDPRIRRLARLSALVGSHAREVGRPSQLQEAARELVLSARAARYAVPGAGRPLSVAIVALNPQAAHACATAVRAAAKEVLPAVPVAAGGSPAGYAQALEVLVEAPASGSQLVAASAIRGCDAAVVVVSPDTPCAEVEGMVRALALVGVTRPVGWLTDL
jgi:hypothetical protein